MDGRGLSEFYDSPMGQRTRRLILRRLRQFWPSPKGRRVLGYGFTRPYLRAFLPEAERCIAAVPVSLGAVPAWPKEKCLTTLTEEDALPFPDAFFDLALVVHGLEEAEGLRPLLRQLWKVLAPEGRLLIVAANKALVSSGTGWEKFGGRFFPALGGVHIVEASKSLYAPATPVTARARTRAQLKTAGTE